MTGSSKMVEVTHPAFPDVVKRVRADMVKDWKLAGWLTDTVELGKTADDEKADDPAT